MSGHRSCPGLLARQAGTARVAAAQQVRDVTPPRLEDLAHIAPTHHSLYLSPSFSLTHTRYRAISQLDSCHHHPTLFHAHAHRCRVLHSSSRVWWSHAWSVIPRALSCCGTARCWCCSTPPRASCSATATCVSAVPPSRSSDGRDPGRGTKTGGVCVSVRVNSSLYDALHGLFSRFHNYC